MNATTSLHQDRSSTGTTVHALLVAGVVAAIIGLAALVGGAVLVGVHLTQRDGAGFYSTGSHPLSTPTRALVSDGLDVGTNESAWLFRKGRLATIRVTATGTAAQPIFIGIARSAQLGAYLRGVAHDEITDFDVDPFNVTRVRHDGAAAPTAPATQRFWAASASGSGRQGIRWGVRKGSWNVVVMNSDGSRGVGTEISVGAKVPFILWLGIGFLAAGVLFVVAGAFAIYRGRRRRAATPPPLAASS